MLHQTPPTVFVQNSNWPVVPSAQGMLRLSGYDQLSQCRNGYFFDV